MRHRSLEPVACRSKEQLLALGSKSAKAGEAARWVQCWVAWNLVGTYKKDATLSFSKQVKRSVSTIEDWAHAYDLYRRLRVRFHGIHEVHELRLLLPYTYWASMWRLARLYKLDEEMILDYLIQAVGYDLTVGDMIGGIHHHEWGGNGQASASDGHNASVARQEAPGRARRPGTPVSAVVYVTESGYTFVPVDAGEIFEDGENVLIRRTQDKGEVF